MILRDYQIEIVRRRTSLERSTTKPLVGGSRRVFLHYHEAANSICMRLREPAKCTAG